MSIFYYSVSNIAVDNIYQTLHLFAYHSTPRCLHGFTQEQIRQSVYFVNVPKVTPYHLTHIPTIFHSNISQDFYGILKESELDANLSFDIHTAYSLLYIERKDLGNIILKRVFHPIYLLNS